MTRMKLMVNLQTMLNSKLERCLMLSGILSKLLLLLRINLFTQDNRPRLSGSSLIVVPLTVKYSKFSSSSGNLSSILQSMISKVIGVLNVHRLLGRRWRLEQFLQSSTSLRLLMVRLLHGMEMSWNENKEWE